MRERIVSIDILKVFAVVLVMNSHMETCYGKFDFFATGGAIGDALFFFCSGFTLLLGGVKRFDNWYKRRINRIYPTVFVVAIIGELFFQNETSIVNLFLWGGGWFVSCIMIYYVILYPVKRYLINYLKPIFIISILVSIALYYLYFGPQNSFSMYGDTYYKWMFNFIYMLFGAIIGYYHSRVKGNKFDFLRLIGCVVAWYAVPVLSLRIPVLISLQYISLLPLIGICYYFYKICTYSFWIKLYNHYVWGQLIFIVGGICLEVYMIQFYLWTDKLNFLFPLNIPLMMAYVLIVAYITKFFANTFSQTFDKGDYNWKKMILYKC